MANKNSKSFTIDDIQVEISKKRMKNMYIRVDNETGVVKVSIPQRVSYDTAKEFVIKNLDWVNKTREQVLLSIESRAMDYVSGEQMTLWGQKYEIEYIPSYCEKGVYIKDDKVVILAPLDSDSKLRKSLVDKWLREILMEEIISLEEECFKITNKKANEWRIKDMKTKWGTCNYVDSRIWISAKLVGKKRECLRYVMIHELTHLYVHNHGPQFKAYMDMFCPEWRQIRKLLNERE